MTQVPDASARSRAYNWTRDRILDGSFASGTMITEGEVSTLVGVSRTPVREAFLRLESEGMLDLFPKRGALVVPITAVDIRNVMEARLLVEPWAVSVAAGLSDRMPLVEDLQRLVVDLRHASIPDELLNYQEADRSFHEAIVAATQNDLVSTFYRSLRDRQLRMGAVAVLSMEGRSKTIVREHEEIVEALAEGDAERASASVHAHITHTREALDLVLRMT